MAKGILYIKCKGLIVLSDNILKLIKSNRPEEKLTPETDCFGTIPKGDMIKDFLFNIAENPEADIKMLAIFGEWGCGKTSLMHWIENNLPQDKFYPVFFEAWRHENDDNLALSLVDVISENKVGIKDIAKEVCLAMGALLKGVTKSITVDIANIPGMPGVKVSGEKIVQEMENYLKDDSTFYEKLERFKDEYKELENKILGEQKDKRLIVFIDDLDRCEPENILSLISVIKLFFTYGERSIFICGIDKDAVNKAVQHKYKDVIKSEEYLEKIFDISFEMPLADIGKMLNCYFPDENTTEIERFFYAIDFTNARHLKKVLNQFLLLKYYKDKGIGLNIPLIPDLNNDFYRIVVLFFIILYKFDRTNYEVIKRYDEKLAYYVEHSQISDVDKIKDSLILNYKIANLADMKKQEKFGTNYISGSGLGVDQDDRFKRFASAFLTIFAPKIDNYIPLNFNNPDIYYTQFLKENNYLSRFCSYLYKNRHIIPNDQNYKFWNVIYMAELFL